MKGMTKKEIALKATEELKKLYPEAICSLVAEDPFQLLVATRLSAQCTDARVNIVCEELFRVFPTAEAMANGDIAEIERIVKPCGLYHTKAESIKAASIMLINDFGGQLPDNMDDLLKFPGVGRKIANLLLGDVFGKEAIVCDTHCIRICGRLGMYPEKQKDPTKIEKILRELMDLKEGSDFCHRIVFFGREVCSARNPRCDSCPLADLCLKREKENGKG